MSSLPLARAYHLLYLCVLLSGCRSNVEGLRPAVSPQRPDAAATAMGGQSGGQQNDPIDNVRAGGAPGGDAAAAIEAAASGNIDALMMAATDDAATVATPVATPADAPAAIPDAAPTSAPTCTTGEVQCLGAIPQTCGADGKWITAPPCPFACRGGCVNKFTAASAGRGSPTDDEGVSQFGKNGETFYSQRGGLLGARGFNVAVLDPATGAMLEPVRNFDPWTSLLSGNAFKELAQYLDAIEPGRLVLLSVCDDAGLAQTNSCEKANGDPAKKAIEALERLGAKEIGNYCFRGAWSFIALTGTGALAEKLSTGNKVTAEAFLPTAP